MLHPSALRCFTGIFSHLTQAWPKAEPRPFLAERMMALAMMEGRHPWRQRGPSRIGRVSPRFCGMVVMVMGMIGWVLSLFPQPIEACDPSQFVLSEFAGRCQRLVQTIQDLDLARRLARPDQEKRRQDMLSAWITFFLGHGDRPPPLAGVDLGGRNWASHTRQLGYRIGRFALQEAPADDLEAMVMPLHLLTDPPRLEKIHGILASNDWAGSWKTLAGLTSEFPGITRLLESMDSLEPWQAPPLLPSLNSPKEPKNGPAAGDSRVSGGGHGQPGLSSSWPGLAGESLTRLQEYARHGHGFAVRRLLADRSFW
jgi:hypothetical protein